MMPPSPRINVGVSWWHLRTACSLDSNIDSGRGEIGIVPTLLTMIVALEDNVWSSLTQWYQRILHALPPEPLSGGLIRRRRSPDVRLFFRIVLREFRVCGRHVWLRLSPHYSCTSGQQTLNTRPSRLTTWRFACAELCAVRGIYVQQGFYRFMDWEVRNIQYVTSHVRALNLFGCLIWPYILQNLTTRKNHEVCNTVL